MEQPTKEQLPEKDFKFPFTFWEGATAMAFIFIFAKLAVQDSTHFEDPILQEMYEDYLESKRKNKELRREKACYGMESIPETIEDHHKLSTFIADYKEMIQKESDPITIRSIKSNQEKTERHRSALRHKLLDNVLGIPHCVTGHEIISLR